MPRAIVGRWRLYHQRITHPPFQHASEVVSWLGAMQGQDYLGTKWAFGLRLPFQTEADIDQAIADRLIMRTWGPRGTLHYIAPADIHWMVALIAPSQISRNARRYQQLELDAATLIHTTELIGQALRDGAHLTRTEILARIEADGIPTDGQRGFYMLHHAGLERVLYQGEMRGSETTYLGLGAGNPLPKEEALAALARRYFTSRGPATLVDFATWSGLPMGEAREALSAVNAELAEEKIGDQVYLHSTEAPQPPQRSIYLLPGFDEFVLGYKDRGDVLEAQFADAICPGSNGIFTPSIVCNGRIVGTWKRTLKSAPRKLRFRGNPEQQTDGLPNKKKTVEITLQPFYPLADHDIPALIEAAQHYGKFLGRQVIMPPYLT